MDRAGTSAPAEPPGTDVGLRTLGGGGEQGEVAVNRAASIVWESGWGFAPRFAKWLTKSSPSKTYRDSSLALRSQFGWTRPVRGKGPTVRARPSSRYVKTSMDCAHALRGHTRVHSLSRRPSRKEVSILATGAPAERRVLEL